MRDRPTPRRRFSLQEALRLLPKVKELTAIAVRETDALTAELNHLSQTHPEHRRLTSRLEQVVDEWARGIQALQADVKGLWLVDFDNGDGYYCWCYPEETISHYHAYDEGFGGRVKIT